MSRVPHLCLLIDEDTELRLYEERHAPELARVIDDNRAHLRQWLPWLDNSTTVEHSLEFIRGSLRQFANNEGFQTGIWYQGKLAGGIGYHTIEWSSHKVEIGYWLAASMQGKGLMTRATKTLVTYAFQELHLNKVEIRCATGNMRSRAIPERLGFTQEGVIRDAGWLYDHFIDLVVYGMLAREWLPGRLQESPW
ncbi:MAG TPA: GNAT family protein [Ktedonobacteraceae bacterium]|nr:GNAT family protein [Ktedonobacteraceae bacterium]